MTKKYSYEQFAATRLFAGPVSYSPDGEWILYADNTSGQFNLWKMPAGGGYPLQLTTFTDNTPRTYSWSPDGEQIAFGADQNGDEQHQIYLIGKDGGWPIALTDKLKVQHDFGDWSPDGQWLAYGANDRDPMDKDVVLQHVETGEIRRLLTGANHFPYAFSPDGKWLIVGKFYGNTDQDILLLNVETGEATNVTPHEGKVVFFPRQWAVDSSGFYFVSNSDREFNNIAFYDIAKDSWDWVFTPEHNIDAMDVSPDGSLAIWLVNQDGMSKLYGRNLETGEDLNLPDLPMGVASTIDIAPDNSKAVMLFVRPCEATNLYEIDLKTGEMIKLAQSMMGGVDANDLAEPELVEFETFDGKMIPAWLYKPQGGHAPYPVILSIHGGPESQERPTYSYNGFYQYMRHRGFGILAPNIRGSTGYGISYQKLIHRDFGGDDLKDIEAAVKYLRALDWVDNNRIAVYGGSYGGFACLSAVTRLPDYWAVGVDIVGPSNLVTFAKAVPPHWKPFMKEWVGDPDEDHDMLMERSPITYVDNLKAPMLIIQGANDPRVVQAESDQMVERIRNNGGDVVYYVDPEEGHGTTRRANAIKWFRMITDYLEDRLLDEPAN